MVGDEAAAYLRGSLLAKLDRLDEVVALSEQAREGATDEEARARWAACLAVALLLRRQDDESVSRAASEAAYAFARLPWVDYVVTAQGMALVERAEYDEGLRLLDRRPEIDLSGMRDAWRVVAHAARGRQSDVIRSMEHVRAVKPWPACLRRAEAALKP